MSRLRRVWAECNLNAAPRLNYWGVVLGIIQIGFWVLAYFSH